jgi:hypothetical protein
MSRKIVVISFFMVFLSFGLSQAQDPGIADTVRLADIYGEIGTRASMPVYLYNDEELTSVVIPLLIDGYSGWLKFDSISYIESRLTDPAILDNRLTYVFASDTFTVDSLLLSFSVSSGDNLPSGTGKLCDLWFTMFFGGGILLDSLSSSPQGGLSLTDASQGTFTPQFSSGMIDITCNYLVGDCSYSGYIEVGDMVMWNKIYYFDDFMYGYPTWGKEGPYDLNCDRRLDMRDFTYLSDIVSGLPVSACTCGTINPPLFDDPGLSDSVWMGSDTMIVGIPSTISVGFVHDEPLTGMAISLEWDGAAVLAVDCSNYNKSYFSPYLTDSLLWYIHFRNAWWANGVNPDTFKFYGCRGGTPPMSLPPGKDTIITMDVTPQTAGTADFRVVGWFNGSPSMLTTEDHEAILPSLSGGHITVLPYLTGDASHDGVIDIGDVVYLINYLYKNGPTPDPLESGDANCDSVVDVSDVVFLINYLFKSGPPPSCP